MKKKSIIIFTILIMIINTFMPVARAVQEISEANLIYDHKIDSHIMYYNETREEWRDIQCGYICYKLDGEKYPAYCITHGVNGVDEEGSYTVTINDLLKDKLIYNTIINGYPYKTPAQLGLGNDKDAAYVATKHAVNSVVLNRDVKTFYKAADEKGEAIINAIYEISEKGKTGNITNKDAIVSINKVGGLKQSGGNYYQEYRVTADANISEYIVNSIENFPQGSYVSDDNGSYKIKFSAGENFEIMMPTKLLDKDINGNINVSATCNTNPIFYGKAPKSNIQDYAITYKPYVKYEASEVLNQSTNTSSIKIIKQDEDTSEPIKNVVFSLYTENDEYITTGKTNSEGIVVFNELYQGKYKIKEITANENYKKDDTVYEVTTEFNKQTIKVITNTHKKGNLKINKVDKEDNNIVLEGIEFDLIDSDNKVVAHLITDKYGKAEINNINIGKYTLKETKTKENYNLCTENNIEVKWNETTEITIQNEKKKGQIKIIKQDKENSQIKLEGVEFQIIDSNNRVVEQIKTDSNGEAISKKLSVGEYKIKEISLGQNEQYLLNEEEHKINVEDKKINEIIIVNEYKKGNLKITKVDKDNNNVFLEGIEFDLIDSDNKVVAHLITDKYGKAEINNINIGKYTLKETKTKESYNLCTDNNIEVKWNETTEITIQNEKKKGQIKIIKQDKENNQIKLEGVEFYIIDDNNEIVEQITTDSKGEAVTKRLPIGEYKIKEISLGQNEHYLLNEQEHNIKVEDEKISKIVIENEHKKGNLKITKVDKDDKTLTLGAIEFDLINENGEKIKNLSTDVNGEIFIENINTGTYMLKETKTKREYNLCENKNIIVEWNKTSDIVIENEKKKGQIKVIKQDAEIEEIKLEGVRFQIIDINNKVVEEIVTNNNGEAISSKLLIGEYEVKEIDLGNNINYLLNNETYTIQVKNEDVTELIVKNEYKKGSLKIIKVDKDDESIALENVKFKIMDKYGFEYETVTNENGIAQVDNIRVGNLTIKETKTNDEYILSDKQYEAEIKHDECVEVTIQNEKKKGQVEIYKTDAENENIKLSNVEFEIIDKNNKVVDKIQTNEDGYTISSKLPIGEYYLKEIKTDNKYILNKEKIKINIEEDEILKLNIKNQKKKGKIQIIKTSGNDSPILNIKQGQVLENVEFEIYNTKNEVVDTLITDNQGKAMSKQLEVGIYKVKEKSINKYYLLNTNEFIVHIKENDEIKVLEVQNEAVVPRIDIDKIGQQFAERNEEIKYEFDIKNISNTKLDNFTWIEYIPHENAKITKIETGTFNENLDYEIYYKTNQNIKYTLFKNVNSSTNEYINFEEIKLLDDEVITEIKVEYKTVSKDFNAIVKPCIYTKISNNVKKDDRIINITKLFGNIEDYAVEDKSSFETIIKEKEILKKLPKTGC